MNLIHYYLIVTTAVVYLLLVPSCRNSNIKCRSTTKFINPVTKVEFVEVEGDFFRELCNDTMDVSLCRFGRGSSGRALYLIKYQESGNIENMYKSGIYCISDQLVINTVSHDTVSPNSQDDFFSLYNFYYENKDTCNYRYYPKWWSNRGDSLKETFDGFCYHKYKLQLICARTDSTYIYIPNINLNSKVGEYFSEIKVPVYSVVRVRRK